ncbi:MAG: hypothetical protein M1829_005843 [Trizodia sp. TS-e1964]|nr:MAG: hypothetical protein M1829_005843 [Trizodia sp. TS-e1964]
MAYHTDSQNRLSPRADSPLDTALNKVIGSLDRAAGFSGFKAKPRSVARGGVYSGPYQVWVFRSREGQEGYLLIPVFSDSRTAQDLPTYNVHVFTSSGRRAMPLANFFENLWLDGKFWPAFAINNYEIFDNAVKGANIGLQIKGYDYNQGWYYEVWTEFLKVAPPTFGGPPSPDTGESE